MKYYLLNVFTMGKDSGNQLAVVMLEESLAPEFMQSIAKEFNFSETVFIQDNILRIFTPKEELPFAGHPTIGAAWILSQLNHKKDFVLKLQIGEVSVSGDQLSARLTFPGTAKIQKFNGKLSDVLTNLHVLENAVKADHVRLVNVGPEFLIIPLNSLEALVEAKLPSLDNPYRVYLVYKQSSSLYKVRMIKAREDAATGSAACALAGYLREVEGISVGKVTISQGVEMGRPSEIQLEWDKSIRVGGQVHLWAEGKLLKTEVH
jgi:trans-2,3-dihydro-3-hydroxyanthranilate isomerase